MPRRDGEILVGGSEAKLRTRRVDFAFVDPWDAENRSHAGPAVVQDAVWSHVVTSDFRQPRQRPRRQTGPRPHAVITRSDPWQPFHGIPFRSWSEIPSAGGRGG
jgi:hypothetical protein